MRTLKEINKDLDVLREKAYKLGYGFTNEEDDKKWKELREEEITVRGYYKRIAYEKAKKNTEFLRIYDEAYLAGMEAGNKVIPVPMGILGYSPISEGVCGFAWVIVKPSYSGFGKWLQDMDCGRYDSYRKGTSIWCGEFGQSMERKEAWADAFAGILEKYNIKAYPGSRMD